MRECIKYMICAVGINTKQNTQKITFFFGEAGRLEEYQKRVLGMF